MSETGQSQSFPYGVTVEISTGSRRIISYLLSPFIRYKDKTLRER
jgi:hemolysin D